MKTLCNVQQLATHEFKHKTTKSNYLLGSKSWRLQSSTAGDEMFNKKVFCHEVSFLSPHHCCVNKISYISVIVMS